jgi:Protein of unknown function (DUF3606)
MRRVKQQPIRNKLDLSDPTQVRLLRKRLHLSDLELINIVDRVGNSLSAIGKEVAPLRGNGLLPSIGGPSSPISASASGGAATEVAPQESIQ